MSDHSGTPKQGTRLPSSSETGPPTISASPQNQNRASRDVEQSSSRQEKKAKDINTNNVTVSPSYNSSPTTAASPSIAVPNEAQSYPPPIYFRPEELRPPSQRADTGLPKTNPTQPPIPSAPTPLPPTTETKRSDPGSMQSVEPSPFGNSLNNLLDVTKADDARRIQQRLSELGAYSGDADGVWSIQAQQALNDFQLANSLPRNRILTKEARRRLFASAAVPVSATNVTTYAGEWASDPSQCLQDNANRAVTSITQRRAEAFGTTCEFNLVERESAAWRSRITLGPMVALARTD